VCLHPTPAAAPWPLPVPAPCPAKALPPRERQRLALAVLAGTESVTRLAEQAQVSRQFVYEQVALAQQALDDAFAPASQPPQERVLFYLPVTKSWLKQLTLALILICHCSVRGVVELLRDLFDYSLSVGQVHAIVHQAVPQARQLNDQQDLSAVRIGVHDEIFQSRQPVLGGADADSTYCYLLSLEEHRDADTWGVRLLELQDRGFAPEATIADFGAGLRAGQKLALPDTPCRGDVFHALQEVVPLVSYLENRAYEAIDCRSKLERQQELHRQRKGRSNRKLSQKIRYARPAEIKALALAFDVAELARWLRQDILVMAGPDYAVRQELYDFVVAELRSREPMCPHRIGPVRRLLENQRDDLLAFARQLDDDLAALGQEWQVSPAWLRELLHVQALPLASQRRWQREAVLRGQLGGRYHPVSEAVEEVASRTVRASSLIENLTGRLRNYFFLRRHLGPDYLALLQFFLNHRRFLRSERPEREGKSPAELLTGQEHSHWLELLGYQRFRQAA
jgi:hypothetical protein